MAGIAAGVALAATAARGLELELLGRYGQVPQDLEDDDPGNDVDLFDQSAAEIPTYDPATSRVFVTNAATAAVDVISIADPSDPVLLCSIPLSGDGIAGPTSVVFTGGVLAVSLAADPKTDPGQVAFFDADGNPVGAPVEVGALPDAITVSPDGDILVTANEGEPNDDNTIDPEGSVSIIDISAGVAAATVETATFGHLNGDRSRLERRGVRIFGQIHEDTGEVDEEGKPVYAFVRNTTVAEDLEPEFAAVSPDGSTAYVTLQENNAVAVVDLDSAEVERILPLGLKRHRRHGNAMDASNKDGIVGNLRRQRVVGMYQPDAIAAYEAFGRTYFVTANEGDSRDYDVFSEEIRGADLPDEGFKFLGPKKLIGDDAKLGRLKTTIAPPETATAGVDRKGNTRLRDVVAYGGRSFSIWSSRGWQVFDSGDDFERITLEAVPDIFNASNDAPEADDRSDDKGPEPEGVIVAEFAGRTYAFITLERVGGIMVYDISTPWRAEFVEYENTRLFADQPGATTVEDDLGPESLVFIDPEDSPTDEALLVVTNEVSGSTLIFAVHPPADDDEDDEDEDKDEEEDDDDEG